MRLPLWKVQQFQGNSSRTSNVLLCVSSIVKFELLKALHCGKAKRKTPYTAYLPVFATSVGSFHFLSVFDSIVSKITKAEQFFSNSASLP